MHGFYSRFLQSAQQHANNTAVELRRISTDVESYSYAELRRMGGSVGRRLRDSGMSQGVRCAIMAANSPLWVASYLGVMAAGKKNISRTHTTV